MNAVEAWGEALRAWAIPDEILAAAPESPWGFPTELFRRRAEAALSMSPSPSHTVAVEALPGQGVLLDVGVGAGASSLPLAPNAAVIVGVDSSAEMLQEFRKTALGRGVRVRTVLGRWPDVAGQTEQADVVVCHHVLYNVQELAPFVQALWDHARSRVVLEITERHPLFWMNDLWVRFHGLERPSRPTADDAEAALRELGAPVRREDHVVPPVPTGFSRREDAVAFIRRRLCLSPDRDPDVEEALGDRLRERDGLWSTGPLAQRLVTLWWDVSP